MVGVRKKASALSGKTKCAKGYYKAIYSRFS